jgi:5-methylcytosine-specific restriction protein A
MKKSESNKLFSEELTKAKTIYSHLKPVLDKRTKASLNLKLNTVNHLSSVKKLVRDMTILKEASQIVMKASKPISKKSVMAYNKPLPLQEYYVRGVYNVANIYTYNTKNANKSKTYYEDIISSKTFKARSKKEAEAKFIESYADTISSGEDSQTYITKKFYGVSNLSVTPASKYVASSEAKVMMKAVKPVTYDFIPNDEKYNENDGFCVVNTFLGVYSPLIKSLNMDKFIDLCYNVRGESKNEEKQVSLLDVGISDEDDDNDTKKWKISDGVTSEMLYKICEKLDISHYAFDITKKCFLKYVSINQNYPALVYYCVNGHMYYISDKQSAYKLICSSKNIENKLNSMCLIDEDKSDNIYARDIYENIKITDLTKYKNCTIIYTQNNLNEELDAIIATYDYIPKIKNQQYNVTQIHYNKDNIDIVLAIDPNDPNMMTYKDIQALCVKAKIEFRNQSFGALISQMKEKFLNSKSIRHNFTKEERNQMYLDHPNCQMCEKKLTEKNFQIDHILPLACGGSNHKDNLQILCKPCHFEKTRHEQDNGYVKISETESSFNSTTKDIINSPLNASYAFVEKLGDIPAKMANHKVYHFDLNKCRKNELYYSTYEYPLFTVMDEPVEYKGLKKAGLYYVETEAYLPMRGNGWYSLPMISYCLVNSIIDESNIKYALYSSLTVPANYYNGFIDYMYTLLENKAKLSINTMIGMFKPKPREHWKSLMITDEPNVAFHHYLDKKGCFIDSRQIKDTFYYQVYNKYTTESDESESPIYNQILELEAIEVHKLMKIIRDKDGIVLDVSTDCVSCVFPDNKLPFEMLDNINIKGFYYDTDNKMPKYKLEDKDHRIKVERLSKYVRKDTYNHKDIKFDVSEDVTDNDFKPLVDMIINSKKSFHIDGRAGCGKSTLIKMLQAALKLRGFSFNSLAPTNKACIIINGETIHRFVASHSSGKSIKELNCKYIFIDEISMMSEVFYKYFIVFKRMRPDIKFIIAGDFAQLLPVKERIENCDYKNSIALHELCDGNRLQLSKCRRSDDTLFNMLLPGSIEKLTKGNFANTFTDRHICHTNKKRISINNLMMTKAKQKAKKEGLKFNKLAYDDNSQDVELFANMPIISRKNSKDLNIVNNETFTIKAIMQNKKIIVIEADKRIQEIKFDDFQKMFYVAYCITVHKSQGCSFDHPYTIHEFNNKSFDDRLKYVALSRATDLKLINVL